MISPNINVRLQQRARRVVGLALDLGAFRSKPPANFAGLAFSRFMSQISYRKGREGRQEKRDLI